MMDGECMYCELQNPPFLHHVYPKKGYLQLCTTCLLNMYREAFCPICFQVYETKDINSSQNRVICYSCPAMSHLACVASTVPSSSTSTTTSLRHIRYRCRSCSDPKFKFFNFCKDDKTKSVLIDKHLAQQLLAASIISQQSMKEAAILSERQAEIKAVEAMQARKEAKLAIERLIQLTSLINSSNINAHVPDMHGSEDSVPSSSQHGENVK